MLKMTSDHKEERSECKILYKQQQQPLKTGKKLDFTENNVKDEQKEKVEEGEEEKEEVVEQEEEEKEDWEEEEEEDWEEDEEEAQPSSKINDTAKPAEIVTSCKRAVAEEQKSRDELVIVEKRKMWRKPVDPVEAMAHGKWSADGVWRIVKRGKSQSELLKEELKTVALELGSNNLREEVEHEETIWKEIKKMVQEKSAQEKIEEEKWAKAKAEMLKRQVEEETKKLQHSEDGCQLEYEMIERIRKRVYMSAEEREEEERLAQLKEREGALRPSLFANVPPYVKFVPATSLRGDGGKGRTLCGGMERMGWYNYAHKHYANKVLDGWAIHDCIEYNGFKVTQVRPCSIEILYSYRILRLTRGRSPKDSTLDTFGTARCPFSSRTWTRR